MKPNIVKGSFFALIAFFFMALFGILTKMALQTGSTIWVSFLAYLTGTIALMPYVSIKGINYLKSEHYGFLIWRALIGTLASFLYTISILYIPIVNGTLLFNTAPIFIPIISVLFLKMQLSKSIWLAVATGFLGIIIIIKPTSAIFTQLGNLVGLSSGIALAIAYLLMKTLTRTDPPARIIFYYLGLGALVQIPLLLFFPFPEWNSALFACISGLVLLIAQLFLIKAYQYAEASQVGVYQYSSIAFVGVLDSLIWGFIPGISTLVGIILVSIAGIIIIRNK